MVRTDLQHRLVCGHDVGDGARARCGGEALVLLLQLSQAQRTVEDGAKHRQVDGLLAEIISAEADGAQHVLALALPARHHDGQAGRV
jgi:hypothetical protein